jgi:hypothetical protein
MTSIRPRLKQLVDLLSEINQPPEPPAALVKALDAYTKTVTTAQELAQREEKWRELLAELANTSEEAARKKLDQLNDADFKLFCAVNKIKAAQGSKAIKVKGKVTQKKRAGKPATKKKPAQAAIPEIREPDTVIPAASARQATNEVILDQAARLKSQATI